MSDKISIIVSNEIGDNQFKADENSKSARNPFDTLFNKQIPSIVEVETNVLKQNITKVCTSIAESLDQVSMESSNYSIDQASFNLVFDSKGGVNLLSSVSGEVKVQTGITVTLKPKK